MWSQDITATIRNPFCAQSEDGSIFITVNTGYPPYQYLWWKRPQNGPDEFITGSTVITGLSSNYTYFLSVTDSYCGDIIQEYVLTPNTLNPFFVSNFGNVHTCYINGNNTNDGFIELSNLDVEANLQPITYEWEGPDFYSLDRDIYDLEPGTYRVTITTGLGCSYTLEQKVCCCYFYGHNEYECPENPSSPMYISSVIRNCTAPNISDGVINITVENAQGTPIFLWEKIDFWPYETIGTTEDIANLSPGEYSVTVTDGCETVTEQFIVRVDNCYDSNGNITIDVLDSRVVHTFQSSDQYAWRGRIELDIFVANLPYNVKWTRVGSGAVIGDEDILIAEPGFYEVEITDATNCTVHKAYEIKSCSGSLDYSIDFSNAAYCWNGSPGEIEISMDGVAPYSVWMYKSNGDIGDLATRKLEFVSDVTTYSSMVTMSGIDETAVYYIFMSDALGNCNDRVQFIPCKCDVFDFTAFTYNACGGGFLGWGARKIKLGGVYAPGISEYPNADYFMAFMNGDLLDFEIVWPENSPSSWTHLCNSVPCQEPFIGENEWKTSSNNDVYVVEMNDPFGCTYSHTYTFGERRSCIADGYDFLPDILSVFYNQDPLLVDVDNMIVDVGCFSEEVCGGDGVYCSEELSGPLPEEGQFYQVDDGPVLDPRDPCNSLKFVCPLYPDDEYEFIPGEGFYTQFIDWDHQIGTDQAGNCIYPCGCLYAPGSFPGQNDPIWVETEIVIPLSNCDDRDPVSDPGSNCVDGCSFIYFDPIFNTPGECLLMASCLIPPCEVEISSEWATCFQVLESGLCNAFSHCEHTGETFWDWPVFYNMPCPEGLGSTFIHTCDDNFPRGPESKPNGSPILDSLELDSVGVLLYPNPVSNSLNFAITGVDMKEINITISDIVGRTLFLEKQTDVNKYLIGKLDVSFLDTGVYVFGFYGKDISYSKVFVKI